MRRKLFICVLGLVLAVGLVGTAWAILWGEPDGDDHPYVGLLVFDVFVPDVGNVPAWRCSGTLISPTVVLTAGHCTYGAVAARVWFDTDVSTNVEYPFGGLTSVEGTPFAHPGFDGTLPLPNSSDVGVVVLDEVVAMGTYGALPALGAVDDLTAPPGPPPKMNVVGYGVQETVPNPNVWYSSLVRYQADPKIVELKSKLSRGYNIHLSNNPGKGGGTGGTCFGDSGGPALLDTSSNVVGGVGSFVLNKWCVGAGFYYRVDTQYAQDFINSFLP